MRRIAALAAAADVTLLPRSFDFGPGLAATVHFAAPTGAPYIEFPPGDLAALLLVEPPRCLNGHVAVSDRPGLGRRPHPPTS